MKLTTLMMSAAISALIAGGAVAQTDTTDTTVTDGAVAADVDPAVPQFTSISEMTVGDLVGQNVYGPDGGTVGDVDYVVGRDGGGLAIIGIGGFLGLGEYTVALPLSDFGYDAAQQMVTLDTTKEALKEQPEFDESEVESLPDETPLADLVASSDAPGGDAMTDGASDDGMTGDSAIPDETTEPDAGADMIDDGATTDGVTEDGMTDDAPATGDAATDDAAISDDAPVESETDMTPEADAVEGDTTTE